MLISKELLRIMFLTASDMIIKKEPELTALDKQIGDGDHGIGMKRGFSAVRSLLTHDKFNMVDDLCAAVGIELIKSMGGASGVIFGTMFYGGISELPHAPEVRLEDMAKYFFKGEQEIERRGKSRPGQKTMLDALYPACCALNDAVLNNIEVKEAFKEAAEKSKEGAIKTKDYLSQIGRSKNFHDRTYGIPDPGAISTSILWEGFYAAIEKNEADNKAQITL